MLNFAGDLKKGIAYFEKQQGKYFLFMVVIDLFYSGAIYCLYPPA